MAGLDIVSYLMGKAAGGGGGGGGDVPLLSRAAWDALSTAQKQAYGLVAIEDANSGYQRGRLLNGADYRPSLLVASEAHDILAEEFAEYYVDGEFEWGDAVLTGSGFSKQPDAVRLPIGSMGAIELAGDNQTITAYVLIKNYETTSGDLTLFAVPYAYNLRNQPGYFVRNSTIWRTVYGDDNSTGVDATAWHVLTLALDNGTKTVRYYIDGNAYSSATYYSSGAIVSLAAATAYNQASINADVAWVGVVNGAETEQVILANHANIMSVMSDYFGS